jgi:hypothetical protein
MEAGTVTAIFVVCLAAVMGLLYISRAKGAGSLGYILPVLRNVHGEDDTFSGIAVNQPVCEGMGVFAAKPSMIADGRQFVQYIMKRDLKGLGRPSEESVMQRCLDNLARGIEADVIERGEAKMLSLTNPGGLAAAAIAIPKLHANCMEWLGGEEFVAGAPNLDTLLVCRVDSPLRPELEAAVANADNSAGAIDFDECLFAITRDGITRL